MGNAIIKAGKTDDGLPILFLPGIGYWIQLPGFRLKIQEATGSLSIQWKKSTYGSLQATTKKWDRASFTKAVAVVARYAMYKGVLLKAPVRSSWLRENSVGEWDMSTHVCVVVRKPAALCINSPTERVHVGSYHHGDVLRRDLLIRKAEGVRTDLKAMLLNTHRVTVEEAARVYDALPG